MQSVDVRHLSMWLREAAPPLLLDVREDWEHAIAHLPGTHIPMGEIPARCDTLPRDRPIVVYCHHGMRSAQVVALLAARGFASVYNLKGGIDAWSAEIDPTLPRY
ncbi:MAG TPA: rhodanese-like domain-containing protein [Candidatus Acidoferrales bacterium]|nr:rhodanese-like domain-containing protein [Candidatus Acidoferrales bacterium]